MLRRALVATVSCAAALAAPAAAVAQEPVATPLPPPSVQIVSAGLLQVDGDLQFELLLSRIVAASEFDARAGRIVCLVLSPAEPSRRRVCVGRRDGRLSAALEAIDAAGDAVATPRVLGHARIVLSGDFLRLRASAAALHARLGRPLSWRAAITWRDGGPCEASTDRLACVQEFPDAPQQLPTRASPRPRAPRRAPHLRLLATGDSMIQVVDGYLTSGLADRRATVVRSDAHISTGISKLGMLDWIRKARGQAVSFKPDVTVVALGANDGFPMKTPSGASVGCCDAGWIAEYARRVQSMMLSYARGGRSLVYWMTLPAPRGGTFARVFSAVNPAIRRAAARVPGVRVIELGPVFTPGGKFRHTITFHGRTVDARQPDGVHLSTAGAKIAASLVIARLRADGALPRRR